MDQPRAVKDASFSNTTVERFILSSLSISASWSQRLLTQFSFLKASLDGFAFLLGSYYSGHSFNPKYAGLRTLAGKW